MTLRRIVLVLFVAGALACAAGYLAVTHWLATPLAITGPAATVEIERGESLSTVARKLAERGLLRHPRWLSAYARLTGADAKVRAGEYSVAAGTTPESLLRQFQSGQVVQHSVTFVEGWTFRDLRRALEREPALAQTLRGKSDAEVMSALGEARMAPEGLFFPDTYLFGKGTTDLDILRQARARMQRELAAAWEDRADDLPFATPYDALVLASIVERETANPAERPRIAGVFAARLRIGMRLQTDPTVIYGLGPKFDGNLRRADLERDGPYNTYTRAGLPPTPIAMPGADSIRAAVRPDARGELYFVATGLPDGTHHFSKTLAEHDQAVREYLVRYRQQRKGQ
ncbi:MAG TPA: endolytic transglycosylase MltG [Steroidobacteraceae bacterium]